MKLTELFADEIVREGAITRRTLERVPEGRNDWKPHDKSMPLGRLAMMIAGMPAWLSMIVEKDEFDLNPPGGGSSFNLELKTNKELLDSLDAGIDSARSALSSATEERLLEPWRLLVAGNVVAEKPRHIMLRDSINHLSHHRGQLTVYLRLNGVPVPSIYGPSADDQRFA
jgi:uncharacterized damage-inducible protein DinB